MSNPLPDLNIKMPVFDLHAKMPLGELRVGARVYDYASDTTFYVAAHDHYGEGITTLLTEKLVGVRAFDGAEPDRPGKNVFEYSNRYGNNDYATSNIHQWLNSEDAQWYKPQHSCDRAPTNDVLRYGEYEYEATPGFLSEFSPEFRNALVETPIPVLKRTGRLKGELTHVNAKVFLPSRTEMNKGNEGGMAEGSTLQLFYAPAIYRARANDRDVERYGHTWNLPRMGSKFYAGQVHHPKDGWWYYLRTPNLQYSYLLRVYAPYGSLSFTYANNDIVGVRPLVNVSSSLLMVDTGKLRADYEVVRQTEGGN